MISKNKNSFHRFFPSVVAGNLDVLAILRPAHFALAATVGSAVESTQNMNI